MEDNSKAIQAIPAVYQALKGYFKEKRLTNRAVAEQIGSHQVFVCSILAGRKPIGRLIARRLHNAYGFSEAWLATGMGNMFDNEQDEKMSESNISTNTESKEGEDVMSVLLSNIKLQNLVLEGLKRDVDRLTQMMLDIYNKEGMVKDVK